MKTRTAFPKIVGEKVSQLQFQIQQALKKMPYGTIGTYLKIFSSPDIPKIRNNKYISNIIDYIEFSKFIIIKYENGLKTIVNCMLCAGI